MGFVCVHECALSLLLVRLALFMLLLLPLMPIWGWQWLHTCSSGYKCTQHASLVLLMGGNGQKSPQTPIQLPRLWEGSRAENRGWSRESKWTSEPYEHGGMWGVLCKASLSLRGGGFLVWADAFTTDKMKRELNFLSHRHDLRRRWFITPPQWWQEVALFTVAIETGIWSLYWWYPLSGWEIWQLSTALKWNMVPKHLFSLTWLLSISAAFFLKGKYIITFLDTGTREREVKWKEMHESIIFSVVI